MKCQNCGYENNDTDKFCVQCGSPLIKIKEVNKPVYCANCGIANDSNSHFCLNCGYDLTKRLEENKETNYENVETVKPIKKSSTKKSMNKKTKLITIIICAILLIAGGIGGGFYFKKKVDTKKYNALIDEGDEYVESMEYDEAIAKYMDAIDILPKETTAYIKVADVDIITEDYEDALDILDQAKEEIGNDNEEINEKYDEVTHLMSIEITGTIYDEDWNIVTNGSVVFTSNNSQNTYTADIDNDGSYSINLPKGDYSYTISAENYHEFNGNISIEDDETDLDFYIEPTEQFELLQDLYTAFEDEDMDLFYEIETSSEYEELLQDLYDKGENKMIYIPDGGDTGLGVAIYLDLDQYNEWVDFLGRPLAYFFYGNFEDYEREGTFKVWEELVNISSNDLTGYAYFDADFEDDQLNGEVTVYNYNLLDYCTAKLTYNYTDNYLDGLQKVEYYNEDYGTCSYSYEAENGKYVAIDVSNDSTFNKINWNADYEFVAGYGKFSNGNYYYCTGWVENQPLELIP